MKILMSASVPDPRRNEAYWKTADNLAIRDAVIALAQAALKHDTLIFGGHPAITPIVRSVAENYARSEDGRPATERVRVYQSAFFRDLYIEDLKSFKDIVETTNTGDRESSLDRMRRQMIGEPIAVAFFIGGMEGVEVEYEIASRKMPPIHLVPIGSTGAAAKLLAESGGVRSEEAERWSADLQTNRAYLPVFQRILNSLR